MTAGLQSAVDSHGGTAGGQGGGSQQEAPAGQSPPALSVPWLAHVIGFQWNGSVTRCGLSHTCMYSTWRADTGGDISNESL